MSLAGNLVESGENKSREQSITQSDQSSGLIPIQKKGEKMVLVGYLHPLDHADNSIPSTT